MMGGRTGKKDVKTEEKPEVNPKQSFKKSVSSDWFNASGIKIHLYHTAG